MKFENVDEALDAFKEAAIIHGEATEKGNYKIGNKNYYVIEEAINYLVKQKAIDHLLQFLDSPNASVCVWAAAYLLPVHEKAALIKLDLISHGTGIIAGDAKTTIQEWEKGNLANIRALYALRPS